MSAAAVKFGERAGPAPDRGGKPEQIPIPDGIDGAGSVTGLDLRALWRLRLQLGEASLQAGRDLMEAPGNANWEPSFSAFSAQRTRLQEVADRLRPVQTRDRREMLMGAGLVDEVLELF